MTKTEIIAELVKTKRGKRILAHHMKPISYPKEVCWCKECAGIENKTGCNDQQDNCYRPIGTALTWNEVESSIGDTKAV